MIDNEHDWYNPNTALSRNSSFSFDIGERGIGKTTSFELWKAQKYASMRNIRLNSTTIINDLQNLLELYDKNHNERMRKKTMALLTRLNDFIEESYNKDPEEEK